jgi:hypothetical protein
MEVFAHKIENLRYCEQNPIYEDRWSTFQMASWKKIKDVGFEIIYNGPDQNEEIKSPFFQIDEHHIGIKYNLEIATWAGGNLLIISD